MERESCCAVLENHNKDYRAPLSVLDIIVRAFKYAASHQIDMCYILKVLLFEFYMILKILPASRRIA